jgi:hypothetical protein
MGVQMRNAGINRINVAEAVHFTASDFSLRLASESLGRWSAGWPYANSWSWSYHSLGIEAACCVCGITISIQGF